MSNNSFSAVNRTTAKVKLMDLTTLCALEAREDFVSTIFRVESETMAGITSPYGINAEFITATGAINFVEANRFMAKSPEMRVKYKDIDFSDFHGNTTNDCQEAYLMNMLISWYRAASSEHNTREDYEKGIYKTRAFQYKSTHGVVDVFENAGGTILINLGPPVELDPEVSDRFNLRTKDEYFEYGQAVRWEAKTTGQETFYLVHLLGRDGRSLDHSDVEIAEADLADLCIDNGLDRLRFDSASVDWSDHNAMWRWICQYVEVNRLDHQFAAAMEVLGALIFHPGPTSIEGCLWQYGRLVITLPQMVFTRGVLPILLSGEKYTPSATPYEMRSRMLNEPLNYVLDSALDNVYFWVGMYVCYQAHAHGSEDWTRVFDSEDDLLGSKRSPLQRAEMISLVTGAEVTTLMSDGFRLNYITDGLSEYLHIPDYAPGEEPIDDLRCKSVPMLSTGALLLGAFADQYDEIPHLTGVQEIRLNKTKSGSDGRLEALKLANAYRVFGWDTELFTVEGNIFYKPYAAPQTCVIEAHSVYLDSDDEKHIRVTDVEAREGRNHGLFSLSEVRREGLLKVMYSVPDIRFCLYGSRVKVATVRKVKHVRTLMPTVKVVQGSTIKSHLIRMKASNFDAVPKNVMPVPEPREAPAPAGAHALTRLSMEEYTALEGDVLNASQLNQ